MRKIGVLSDTHSYLHPDIFTYFKDVDEIWHLGDVGSFKVIEMLRDFKPLRGVYGNIDGQDIRAIFPLDNKFKIENCNIWLTHIGGYPNKYIPRIRNILQINPPDIFACGHSHILKVMYDKKYQMLTLNPGAAGKYGFHKIATMLRFEIEGKQAKNMEIIELAT